MLTHSCRGLGVIRALFLLNSVPEVLVGGGFCLFVFLFFQRNVLGQWCKLSVIIIVDLPVRQKGTPQNIPQIGHILLWNEEWNALR